jgi:hypothetical protein
MALKQKYTCGTIVPSSCVPYTGKKLAFLEDAAQPECDANINDVVDKIGAAIKDLKDTIGTAEHDLYCSNYTITDTSVKGLLQAHADKICSIDNYAQNIQNTLNELNVGNYLVSLNLGDLASAASSCEVQINTYQLISVLSLLVAEINAIKTHLGI